MILVLGGPEEEHALSIIQRIKEKGGQAMLFNTRDFPSKIQLSFEPELQAKGCIKLDSHSEQIPLKDIQAVYWRMFTGIDTTSIEEPFLKDMAFREIESCIGSLFRCMKDTLWVNPVDAIELHRYKGYQLQILQHH